MNARRKFILAALTAVFAFAGSAYSQPLTKLRFTLDWRYEGHLSFFMMAKAKGYYEKEGLDVSVDSGAGSVATMNRIVGGSHDMGSADLSSVIEFLGNNPGMEGRFQAVYLLYNRSPMMIQALKKSGIRNPQDLAGKKMAGPIFDSTRKAFPIYARAIGIDPKSVTWVNVDPALRETLLARGDVDAISGFELDKLTLMARGVKEEDIVTFSYADAGLKLYSNVLLASAKLIADHPKAVAAFVRATNRALIEAIANPEESVSYTKLFDPLTDPKTGLAKMKILLRVINTDFAHANGLGAIVKQDLEKQVAEVAVAFALKTRPNADQIFNASFLPPKPERVPRTPAIK
ncbi:MAG: ABC transporter substrate-binding protein [Betaproteobacteria bacterium]|nr:ABC transporter substrate-binding protein [Betaproteobacteria bacterium]